MDSVVPVANADEYLKGNGIKVGLTHGKNEVYRCVFNGPRQQTKHLVSNRP